MDDPFARLGIPTVINAKGTATRLSGGLMRPEVAEAMAAANCASVDMVALQARASEIIADAAGAEAGIVTAGAAAGLLLGTAAAMAGLDPAAMARLPETEELAHEVVMVRSQRNAYDHAIRSAGAVIREVGLPDRIAGAGVRDAELWEIEAAIGPHTAAVAYVAHDRAEPALAEVVAVARRHGVPVIVDAAARVPPRANLRRFIEEGADLVAFSGGKMIGGPQASGILAGRRDLVMSAALQMLDLDMRMDEFDPPPAFIDKARLKGLPPHGIGRSAKVAKEQVVGLLTALRLFLEEDDATQAARGRALLDDLAGRVRGVELRALAGPVPRLALELGCEDRARRAARGLRSGRPPVHVDTGEAGAGRLIVSPVGLTAETAAIVADRLNQVVKEEGGPR